MSRPLQVVLAAAVVFAALWFVALRPKPESGSSSSTPAAPAAQPAKPHQPGSSLPPGLDRSVAKADQARAQANQSAQAAQRAAGTPAPSSSTAKSSPLVKSAPTVRPASPHTPTPTAKAAPGPRPPISGGRAAGPLLQAGVLAMLPGALVRNATARAAPASPHRRTPTREGASPAAVTAALAHRRVVVLLFWDRRGSDDRLVRSELGRVSNHHGRVLVTAAPIRSVSGYGAVTRGVQVLQSPTVLIIDRARRARILTGYTDAAEIGQAVSEALTQR